MYSTNNNYLLRVNYLETLKNYLKTKSIFDLYFYYNIYLFSYLLNFTRKNRNVDTEHPVNSNQRG